MDNDRRSGCQVLGYLVEVGEDDRDEQQKS